MTHDAHLESPGNFLYNTAVLEPIGAAVEGKVRGFLELMPDAVVIVSQSGRIVLVNAQTEASFGYQRSELIGQLVEMILPERFAPSHVIKRDGYVREPVARPMGYGLELFGRRKDGSEFPVEISLSPLTTEQGALIMSSIRDVTVRKQSEQVQAHLAAIVESSSDAIISKTLDGIITSWNPAAEHLYGYTGQDVIGQPISLLISPDWPDDQQQTLGRLCAGERIEAYETQRLRKDGRAVDVLLSMSPIRDHAGKIVGAATITHDITDRRAVEAERTARGEAEAAVRLRDEFLAVAAHELNTPITSLRGFCQLLLSQFEGPEAPDPEAIKRALRTINIQSGTLARLVSQLLDVARVRAGRLKLQMEPADVVGLVRGAVAAAQVRTQTHIFQVTAPVRFEINIDSLRMEQVLTNLLDNAIKYSPDGGRIDVTIRLVEPSTLQLTVADQGMGVRPGSRSRIFERSYQADAESYQSGLGMGLYISRQIIEMHGGSISAHFPRTGGTNLVVDLPVLSLTT